MKIIVQTGGLGSRMGYLTKLKPKALIPVKGLPVLFHLFKTFNGAEFIIISDYKFDVLDKYLTTFANGVNYILFRPKTKGDISGIKDVLSYIPDDEEFMIVWSDLIFPAAFKIPNKNHISDGCMVGIGNFPCSWSLDKNNKMQHVSVNNNGVAGCYIFKNKSVLVNIPDGGDFATYLKESDINITPFTMDGVMDIGTLEAYNKIESFENKCRPYNNIKIKDNKVIKTANTNGAKSWLLLEADWYKKVSDYGFDAIPIIYDKNPLTMSYIVGNSLFKCNLDNNQKNEVLNKVLFQINRLHSFEAITSNSFDLYSEYYHKTIMRLRQVQNALIFASQEFININSKKCINILNNQTLFREAILSTLMQVKNFNIIHGDSQFTNIMFSKNKDVIFIDPRGYFGKTKLYGDARYDYAKLYYSIIGNFDNANIRKFDLDINDNAVTFNIESSGFEFLKDNFLYSVKDFISKKELDLIHSLIWLSLSSHAFDDFDTMNLAFYKGTLLFTEWIEEYNFKYKE